MVIAEVTKLNFLALSGTENLSSRIPLEVGAHILSYFAEIDFKLQ